MFPQWFTITCIINVAFYNLCYIHITEKRSDSGVSWTSGPGPSVTTEPRLLHILPVMQQ